MDINALVDEILKEDESNNFTLFALVSETNGFANAINLVRSFNEGDKAVIMCETLGKLFPLSVAKEMLGNVKILKSDYFRISGNRFAKVKKIIVPVFPLTLASSLASLTGEGVISTMLCNALTNKIPIEVSENELNGLVLQNPELKTHIAEIKEKLSSLGVTFFTLSGNDSYIQYSLNPELEVMVELTKHLGDCELEDGTKCINCEKCKVRGF